MALQIIEATVIGVTLVGIAWLASWRLARPRPRHDDTYGIAHGDWPQVPNVIHQHQSKAWGVQDNDA